MASIAPLLSTSAAFLFVIHIADLDAFGGDLGGFIYTQFVGCVMIHPDADLIHGFLRFGPVGIGVENPGTLAEIKDGDAVGAAIQKTQLRVAHIQ